MRTLIVLLAFVSMVSTALADTSPELRAGAEKCEEAKRSGERIWASCEPVLKETTQLESLLTIPAVIEEVNAYPDRLTTFTDDIEDRLNETKFGVIAQLLKVDSRFDTRILGYRFAVELYKTMDGQPATCEFRGGYEVCLGSKNMARVLMEPKVPRPDRDLSQMKVNRHVAEFFREIVRNGYLDRPDAPPSKKYAQFPPPSIRGWSEVYEQQRSSTNEMTPGIGNPISSSSAAGTQTAGSLPSLTGRPVSEPVKATPRSPNGRETAGDDGSLVYFLVAVAGIVAVIVFALVKRKK